ncbi:MAG: hypothetical protein ABEI75_03100, partial [Halobaculum sp.]
MTEPNATAWERTRRAVAERAATLESDGRRVVRVTADHAAVDPAERRLLFTVGDSAADRLRNLLGDAAVDESRVSVADGEGVRFLLIETVGDGHAAILAGGVDHRLLRELDPDAPVRTVVRRADGERAAVLTHGT